MIHIIRKSMKPQNSKQFNLDFFYHHSLLIHTILKNPPKYYMNSIFKMFLHPIEKYR